MYLIFDTETTGLPKKWNAPVTDSDNWPRCIQLAWQLHDKSGKLTSSNSFLIKPDNFDIPFESEKVHGISTALALKNGLILNDVIKNFLVDLEKAKYLVGHNVKFDINIIGAELYRLGIITKFSDLKVIDTCTETTANLCQIKGGRSGKFRFPTLIELYEFLFSNQFEQAHNASADVEATARSFFELIRSDVLSKSDFENFEDTNKELKLNYDSKIPLYGLNHINLKVESKKLKEVNTPTVDESSSNIEETFSKNNFVHLHTTLNSLFYSQPPG